MGGGISNSRSFISFLALLLAGPDQPDISHSLLRYSLFSVSYACTFLPALTVSKQFESTLPTLHFPFLVNSSRWRMVWNTVADTHYVFLDLAYAFFLFLEFEFYDRKFTELRSLFWNRVLTLAAPVKPPRLKIQLNLRLSVSTDLLSLIHRFINKHARHIAMHWNFQRTQKHIYYSIIAQYKKTNTV